MLHERALTVLREVERGCGYKIADRDAAEECVDVGLLANNGVAYRLTDEGRQVARAARRSPH